MRVLFDQATPVPIRTFLIGHTVRTAAQEHWDTLQNGDLLTVAEHAGFEVFLTTDKNMRYQQNMAGRTTAVAFPLHISKRARAATQRTAPPQPYSCVSHLSAAAGSITCSGALRAHRSIIGVRRDTLEGRV